MMNEFDKRCRRLRQKMQEASVDAYLVTSPDNIYYLSGFTGDAGVLLVTEQERYLITDARFETQIAQTNPWLKAVITRDYFRQALELCEREHVVALAFEESLSYQVYDQLDEYAPCDLVALSGLIETLRSQKSAVEIEKIKASCRLAKAGFEHVLKAARPGLEERDLALELDHYMRKNGASQASFETIVASGTRSALPHGVASNKKLASGDLVTLDYGYFLDHYTSDVTRTFALGKVDPRLKEIYNIVSEAKQLTIEAVRPGITGKELDQIGREYITQKGYDKYFEHGMGHGIGLNVHEGPYIGKTSTEVLQPGQVITIEPGIYLPDLGGVRLEDDILVTETGYENLTDFYQEYYEI